MGVQGLWQVIEKTKKPITLDSLEGKRLAVDISLWLCQAAHGYNTYSFGSRSPHIQLLVSRIAKLLFYKIHPIFVFDGKNVPSLKKQVLNERALRRHMDDIRLNKKQRIMLEQLAKQQLNSVDPEERTAAEQQLWTKLVNQHSDDVFELPELPEILKKRSEKPTFDSYFEEKLDSEDSCSSSSESDNDFLDVTDDEETVQAILNSCKEPEPDVIFISSTHPSTSYDSIDDQRIDLEILNERIKRNPTFSQRINLQSTANQLSSPIERKRATSDQGLEKSSKKSSKRKSAPSDIVPSPKKSVLPRAAGTAEDDWLPNAVVETANTAFKTTSKTVDVEDSDANDNLIQADCQQLLSFLGLPYLVANGEAEAQCVELERMNLCDGVVTDDSDAWLFGVQKCYKNMFSNRAQVEEYDAKKIEKELGLTRTKFVAIAMLSGGDYCHGFDGVGCITALKLIKGVGDVNAGESSDSESDEEESYEEGFERLQRIRTWLDSKAKWLAKNKTKKLFREPKARIRLRRTIETRNDEARIESFPSDEVYSAYMKPDVNENSQHFEWQSIEFDELHDFLWSKIGWSPDDLKANTHRSLDNWNEFVKSNMPNDD